MNVHYQRVKLIVQGVIAEINEQGEIVGEQTTQQLAVYSPEQLFGFVAKLDEDIAAANANLQEQGSDGPRLVEEEGATA